MAKSLALAAENARRLLILSPIPKELHLTGAHLASMMQAIAYRTIRSLQGNQVRPRTQKMIRNIQQYEKRVNGSIPSESTIWKSIRNKDFSRQIRVFL